MCATWLAYLGACLLSRLEFLHWQPCLMCGASAPASALVFWITASQAAFYVTVQLSQHSNLPVVETHPSK
jgi:hypothetical protein